MGSIPFLNNWLREAIRSTLSTYVTPRYVSVDVAELLDRQVIFALSRDYYALFSDIQLHFSELLSCREKSDSISIVPTIDNLRRKTRSPISCPRTSTPRGIAITSVADQLESHHSSLQVAGSDVTQSGQEPLSHGVHILKPVTELSRLALDRQALKKETLVRPLTELARLGMDRWLNSTVMTKRTMLSNVGSGTVGLESQIQFDFNDAMV